MAVGEWQVTELHCTISLEAFGLDLGSECESYLLIFHLPKQVTCSSLSGMGKATSPLGVHIAIDRDVESCYRKGRK